MSEHPMQPMYEDKRGIVRFKENEIVQHLLEISPSDLNDLARLGFSNEDQAQFAQLIGYSVSGWGDLSYVSREDAGLADWLAMPVNRDKRTELDEAQEKVRLLKEKIEELKSSLRKVIEAAQENL